MRDSFLIRKGLVMLMDKEKWLKWRKNQVNKVQVGKTTNSWARKSSAHVKLVTVTRGLRLVMAVGHRPLRAWKLSY